MPKPRPSDLELQVLSVLWERGPSTVREIREAIPDGRQRAYTTILSVVQVMEKKGLVDHSQQGLAHLYRPCVRRQQVLRPLLRDLLRNVFGGSPAQALQHLLDSTPVDAEELAAIRRILDEARNQQGGKS